MDWKRIKTKDLKQLSDAIAFDSFFDYVYLEGQRDIQYIKLLGAGRWIITAKATFRAVGIDNEFPTGSLSLTVGDGKAKYHDVARATVAQRTECATIVANIGCETRFLQRLEANFASFGPLIVDNFTLSGILLPDLKIDLTAT